MQSSSELSFASVEQAMQRIDGKVQRTPILESSTLNQWLGRRILFKAECLQTIGAFKLRGAMNFVTKLQEQGSLPKHLVANSSGNHAQAVAYAARAAGIKATIYASDRIANVKAQATAAYGAELKLYATRTEADEAVAAAAEHDDCVWVPPFDHPDIIAGQGTAALEALQDCEKIDAIFAPCGGGGLLAGSLLAAQGYSPSTQVIGAEPLNANDASQSLQSGVIERLKEMPDTLADGAATPAVGIHTFPLLQQLDDFYEVDEVQIAYWTQWLQHLLKLHVEPTSAMSMAAVAAWVQEVPEDATALVILSGGNISQASQQKIWQTDYLCMPPSIA